VPPLLPSRSAALCARCDRCRACGAAAKSAQPAHAHVRPRVTGDAARSRRHCANRCPRRRQHLSRAASQEPKSTPSTTTTIPNAIARTDQGTRLSGPTVEGLPVKLATASRETELSRASYRGACCGRGAAAPTGACCPAPCIGTAWARSLAAPHSLARPPLSRSPATSSRSRRRRAIASREKRSPARCSAVPVRDGWAPEPRNVGDGSLVQP
jgi:hypothetical protein